MVDSTANGKNHTVSSCWQLENIVLKVHPPHHPAVWSVDITWHPASNIFESMWGTQSVYPMSWPCHSPKDHLCFLFPPSLPTCWCSYCARLLSHQSRHLDTRPVILTCNGLIGLNHLHILLLLSVMGKTYTVPFIKGWMVYGGVHVAVKYFDLNKNFDTTVPFSIHQQVPPTLQCLVLSVLRISSHYKVCRNASSEQYRKQMYLHILLPPAHLLPLLHLWWTKI